MKKIISTFLLSMLLFSQASATPLANTVKPQEKTVQELIVPKKLEEAIKDSIVAIYGRENLDKIYNDILYIIKKGKEKRDVALKEQDLKRDFDWYKEEVIYMFYPDQFGVENQNTPNTFSDLISMLPYLKDLGVTTIYIMPFADSPMSDSGFDVKNPKNVRNDLGGMKEFEQFAKKAKEQGFKIKADLILNHFSDEHQWFKEALAGDLEKLDYFIVRKDMPEYKTYVDEKIGHVAEYKEPDGKITKRRLIFPEISDNHYRKVTIKGQDYYLYHTFYPFQLDINFENPKVLYYVLETVSLWANLGIDIFRLDAIPYYTKEEGTTAENLPKTHQIIQLVSAFLQAMAPSSIVQAEACQKPKQILPYFGKDKKVKHVILGSEKEIQRTDEVQICYHFPYMPSIWASLITADNKHFWDAYKETPKIPDSAAWAIFLRVHDELTLEMVNQQTRSLLYDSLSPKGAAFRKGYGISGRLANFLDNDPDRIAMAFSIMLSLQGVPIIYYGDEIGVQNNFSNARKSALKREKKQKTAKNKVKMLSYFDSRDINRGPIEKKVFYSAKSSTNSFNAKIYRKVKNLIRARKSTPVMSKGSFTQIKTKTPDIFAYVREYNNERVIVINNLSSKKSLAQISFINDDFGKKVKDVYFKDINKEDNLRF